MALADFFAEGHFARYVQRMRDRYLERRDILLDALRRELRDSLEVGVPEAGMHLVAWLSPDVDGATACRAAAGRGLRIEPVSHFSVRRPARDGLMLGFARESPEDLRAGVRELAVALRSLPVGAPAGPDRRRHP
jgi:GntR family transcriptional regulator/MocR family aminotransferase